MLPKTRGRDKRNLREISLDDTKENNDKEVSGDAAIKTEVESSLGKCGYGHSTSLCSARRIDCANENVPAENVAIKREDTSEVALSTASNLLQDIRFSSSSFAMKPELAVDTSQAVGGGPSTSHPLSEMQAIIGKPVPVPMKSEECDTICAKATVPVILDCFSVASKGQKDEIEVIKEITDKEIEMVDLTDDTSPPSTLPPSPVTEDPETGAILSSQNVGFPTPFLRYIEDDFRFNIEVISELQTFLTSFEILDISSEDEAESTSAESVIICNSPSNIVETEQTQERMEEEDITILETLYSGNLQTIARLPTSPGIENAHALSKLSDTVPSQNSQPSTSKNLESSATPSQILLENSPSLKKGSVFVPSTSVIPKTATDVKAVKSKTDSFQSVVFPAIPPPKELCAAVEPAIAKTSLSQTLVLPAISRIDKLCATVAPTLQVPSQTMASIEPVTYPITSYSNSEGIPMEISPPSSPTPNYLSRNDSFTKNLLKEAGETRVFSPPSRPAIKNMASNINTIGDLTARAFQTPPAKQAKRPRSPVDASVKQPSSKKLNINEYRKRLNTDPRRRSSSNSSSPPVFNLPQTASPCSDNGNVFSTLQSNIATLFPQPQYQLQSTFHAAQAFSQYPLQSHLYPFQNSVYTASPYYSSLHQPQIISPEERTAQFFAQQSTSQLPVLSLHSHPDPTPPLLAQSKMGSRQYSNQRTTSDLPIAVPSLQSAGTASLSPANRNFDKINPIPSVHQNYPLPSIAHQSVSPFNSAQTKPSPATRSLPNVQSPLHHTMSLPMAQPLLRARPHQPSTLTNLPRPVRPVATTSMVGTPDIVTQPPAFISSVPESLRRAIGQFIIKKETLVMVIIDCGTNAIIKKNTTLSLPRDPNQVRDSYTDLLDYYNTYFPLMLVEFWNKLFLAYDSNQRREFFFCVTDYQEKRTNVDEDTEVTTYLLQCDTIVKTCDVAIVPTNMQVIAINTLSGQFLGFVHDSSRRDFSAYHDREHPTLARNSLNARDAVPKSKMKILVEVSCSNHPFERTNVFSCFKVCSMKGLIRQNDAMIKLGTSPFEDFLLSPVNGNDNDCRQLQNMPLGKRLDEMTMALSDLTNRVQKKDHHITLAAFSDAHSRAEQLQTLAQIVRRLRQDCGCRLLVVCRDEKVAEVAERIHELGYDMVVLDREIRPLGDAYRSFDALSKQTSKRLVLQSCEVMLAASNCFYEDIQAECEASGAPFDTCVLFDAHHFTEPESLLPLRYPLRHLVLVGVQGKQAKNCTVTSGYEFGKSLFQRVFNNS